MSRAEEILLGTEGVGVKQKAGLVTCTLLKILSSLFFLLLQAGGESKSCLDITVHTKSNSKNMEASMLVNFRAPKVLVL